VTEQSPPRCQNISSQERERLERPIEDKKGNIFSDKILETKRMIMVGDRNTNCAQIERQKDETRWICIVFEWIEDLLDRSCVSPFVLRSLFFGVNLQVKLRREFLL